MTRTPQRPPTPQERETLAALAGASGELLASTAIAASLGLDTLTIRKRLSRLMTKGLAEKRKRADRSVEWRISPAGRAALGMPPAAEPPALKPARPAADARRPRMTPKLDAALAVLTAMPDGGKTAEIATALRLPHPQVARERLLRLERMKLVERCHRRRGGRVDLCWRAIPDAVRVAAARHPAICARADAEIWFGRFGGATAVAARLGLDRSTVEQWTVHGIPAKWREQLEAAYDGAMIEAELDRRLAATAAGSTIEYWRGWLVVDTEATDRPGIRQHARAVQAWARRHATGDSPAVTLTQIRHGEGDYAYLAVKLTAGARHAA